MSRKTRRSPRVPGDGQAPSRACARRAGCRRPRAARPPRFTATSIVGVEPGDMFVAAERASSRRVFVGLAQLDHRAGRRAGRHVPRAARPPARAGVELGDMSAGLAQPQLDHLRGRASSWETCPPASRSLAADVERGRRAGRHVRRRRAGPSASRSSTTAPHVRRPRAVVGLRAGIGPGHVPRAARPTAGLDAHDRRETCPPASRSSTTGRGRRAGASSQETCPPASRSSTTARAGRETS